jgi:hypothetical protein
MKYLNTFLLLFIFSISQAQIQDLIENDSISWIAEWDADYLIDDFRATDTCDNNGIGIIKYLNTKGMWGFGSNQYFFAASLWNAVKNEQLKVFSDIECKKLLKNKGALYIGKARKWFNEETDIDPIIYETRTCQIYIPHKYEDVVFYRTRQIIYYNAPKAQFQMQVLAVAPLIKVNENDTSALQKLEPLFYFKPEMGKPNINSEDITWAQLLSSKANSLTFSKAKILKNTLADTVVAHLLTSFQTRLDIPFWEYDDDSLAKIDKRQRFQILHPVDTLMPIQPIHYGNEIKVLQRHYTTQDVKILKLYQEWYWDNRQNKLFINLKMTAPMIPVNDDADNFLYNKPLFFRKTSD